MIASWNAGCVGAALLGAMPSSLGTNGSATQQVTADLLLTLQPFQDLADGVLLVVFEKAEWVTLASRKRLVTAGSSVRGARLLHILHSEAALECLHRPAVNTEFSDSMVQMLPAVRRLHDLWARRTVCGPAQHRHHLIHNPTANDLRLSSSAEAGCPTK